MLLIPLQDLTERPYLQLKIPHTRVTEHGEIKLVLTWDPNSYRLGFIVLESAKHITREKHHSHRVVDPENYGNKQPGKTNPLIQ